MTPDPIADARAFVHQHAPWLLQPELGACIVGTTALAMACARAGVAAPRIGDLDLAWAPSPDAAERLLSGHSALLPVTTSSKQRGTLAMRLGGQRVEITSLRGGDADAPLDTRIRADLDRRESTVAAVAWRLADDAILDPHGGLDHWLARRMEPVGSAAERVAEHPVRWLRWFRRAHEWGLLVSPQIRKLPFDPAWAAGTPRESIAAEFRAALTRLASPGRFFLDLHETGSLAAFAPELAPQFDGRPAGPQRHHPEVSQALHLILTLEWVVERIVGRPEPERAAILTAVLCHDLGKGRTEPSRFPAHLGHESSGVPLVASLLGSLPGLTDAAGRRLTETVCRLHLDVRRLDAMRPGTIAGLYDDHFRHADFPIDAFALAIGADVGGRLGHAAEGDLAAGEIAAAIRSIRTRCETVDVAALRAQFPDVARFKAELHAARARALQ